MSDEVCRSDHVGHRETSQLRLTRSLGFKFLWKSRQPTSILNDEALSSALVDEIVICNLMHEGKKLCYILFCIFSLMRLVKSGESTKRNKITGYKTNGSRCHVSTGSSVGYLHDWWVERWLLLRLLFFATKFSIDLYLKRHIISRHL